MDPKGFKPTLLHGMACFSVGRSMTEAAIDRVVFREVTAGEISFCRRATLIRSSRVTSNNSIQRANRHKPLFTAHVKGVIG